MSKKITRTEWRQQTRRNFLVAGVSAMAAALGGVWLTTRTADNGISWPLRRIHEVNETLWRKLFRRDQLGETPSNVAGPARVNGDIGLPESPDFSSWSLNVSALDESKPMSLTLSQLQQMPQTTTSEVFKCVEGWSQAIAYNGVRFSDFLKQSRLGTRDGQIWHETMPIENLYRYVGLATPDGEYYVSIDIESLLHPKTVLATHLNGEPLSLEHGAPLRLYIPVKYGIKNLKCLGRLFFSDTRPPDYWAERGYDWYAAL
jgi:DMSO/TMAO reductase YedYZ molybdopterin-dependent catalytic subunit